MFEAQVAYYLNRYLGQYVQGLDPESLKISVWSGNVTLRNLKLKPEALADLNLPVTVKSGMLGKLDLKVPWARLGREPVVVHIDRVFILAVPDFHPQVDQKIITKEEADKLMQEAKQQRIEKAEQDLLKKQEAEMNGTNQAQLI
eukprot:TRINITY_DN10334_c0_g1_i3.p2 TRINITY_DN10334_c0_g1~~TRINITY_DN10334_c0_g1_i3.p2  ORF type:complete len:160 (-),score=29.58 TRINITY_DN10334_c0_g1_i3:47-478(-)